MPRKRKTNLPAVPYPGAQYGQGQDQVAQLKQQPLPNQVNATQNTLDQAAQQGPQAGGGTSPTQAGPPPAAPAPYSFDNALQQAQQIEPGSAIDTAGGQSVVTAGMNMGPGAGAEALDVPNQANVFQVLAQTSGDPNFLRLGMMTRMNR